MNTKCNFRATAAILALVIPALAIGCATKKAAAPPSDDLRAQLGTVGLAVAATPDLQYYLPRGRGKGAGQGALGGLKAGGEVAAAGAYSGDGALLAIPLGAATAVVGAPVGAVVGVIRGVPRARSLEAERAITNTFSNVQTQDCLRIEVLHLAREMTRRTFVEIPANVMTESTTNASAGAQPRLQTVLDLRVLSWELGGHARPYINPDFQLIATAEARLIDHANGKVLYTYANSYAGKRRMKFTEWAAAAGQPLRTEFRTTSQEIARDMIEQIFLRTKPLVSRKRN